MEAGAILSSGCQSMRELLQHAIREAEHRESPVRVMALLQCARALSVIDKGASKATFAEALAAAEELTLPIQYRQIVLSEAVIMGAAADPMAAVALFRRCSEDEAHPGWGLRCGNRLVQTLAGNGHINAAIDLLEDLNCEAGGATAVVHLTSDPQLQHRVLSAAHARWRAYREREGVYDRPPFAEDEFYWVFADHWRKLEIPEARAWLEEALQAIEAGPDHACSARFGDRVEFHSIKHKRLFQLLPVMRAHLTAERVEQILAAYPEVRSAAEIYPLGVDTMKSEWRPPSPGAPGGVRFAFAGSGSYNDLPAASIPAASRGDRSAIERSIAEANELYLEDIHTLDPQTSPRVFWPSCLAYRTAMYWAGKNLGKDAEPLLARIPDRDFAFLGGIEMAAGALGLPQHAGVRAGRRTGRPRT